MKRIVLYALFAMALLACATSFAEETADGWVSLFDGKTLEGWKAGGKQGSFRVRDGTIVAHGQPRSDLFLVGPVSKGEIKNFEFKADVMTTPGSNSGIFFHVRYQPDPLHYEGMEVQINNSHRDEKRTGSLYAIQNILEAPAEDDEWFTIHIVVRDAQVVINVNDKTLVDWRQPEGYVHPKYPERKLSRGTIALQAHDPKSVVLFRNLMIKPLP